MADKKLQVRVVTPAKPIFDGVADMVVVPAHDGELGILPKHARLLSSLGIGSLRIQDGSTVSRWFLEGGFVQVRDNLVTVLCERAVTFENLDPDEAERLAVSAKEEGLPSARHLQQRAVVMRRVVGASGAHH